jgi:hypothetical protein
MGRRLQTQLDRLKPDLRRKMDTSRTRQTSYHDQHSRNRSFYENDAVWVRDVQHSRGWIPGIIKRQTGMLSYIVEIDGKHQRRHANQLRLRNTENVGITENEDDDISMSEHIPQTVEHSESMPTLTTMTTSLNHDVQTSNYVNHENNKSMDTIPKKSDMQHHANTDPVTNDTTTRQPEVEMATALKSPTVLPRKSGRSRHRPNYFHEQFNY